MIKQKIVSINIQMFKNSSFLQDVPPVEFEHQVPRCDKMIFNQAENIGVVYDYDNFMKLGEFILKFMTVLSFLKNHNKQLYFFPMKHDYLLDIISRDPDIKIIQEQEAKSKVQMLLHFDLPLGFARQYVAKTFPNTNIINLNNTYFNTLMKVWNNGKNTTRSHITHQGTYTHVSQTDIHKLFHLAGEDYKLTLPDELKTIQADLDIALFKLSEQIKIYNSHFSIKHENWQKNTNFLFNTSVGSSFKRSYQALRQWNTENFTNLGLKLLSDYNESNIFIYKFEENDQTAEDVYAALYKHYPARITIIKNNLPHLVMNIREITALMKDIINVAITPDTGFAHLSAVGNIPTIGLYGATSVKRWGLIGPDPSKLISIENTACTSKNPLALEESCLFEGCNKAQPCINEIKSDKVMEAVGVLVKREAGSGKREA
ncbi:MAG: glycosyltransferase family 9 protein [Candidatus Margulisbacteria bacterium]|nr:glycosyltransferase family 9 protein [Candidatus Margulisiibacteriota bacterium]